MRLTSWLRRREAREDEVWQDGYETASKEDEEVVAEKDAYIERQAGIILDLMSVLTVADAWKHVPQPLYHDLQGYV